MSKERFMFRSAVYLMLLRNNEILLARRFNASWENGKYSLPAGHLDGRETATEAMIREAKEEIDLDLDPKDLKVIHTMHRIAPDHEYIEFFFVTENWRDEPKIMEPDKCNDLSWFSLDKLPENLSDYLKNMIENYKKGITFSEYR